MHYAMRAIGIRRAGTGADVPKSAAPARRSAAPSPTRASSGSGSPAAASRSTRLRLLVLQVGLADGHRGQRGRPHRGRRHQGRRHGRRAHRLSTGPCRRTAPRASATTPCWPGCSRHHPGPADRRRARRGAPAHRRARVNWTNTGGRRHERDASLQGPRRPRSPAVRAGIGLGIAKAFRAEGADVVIAARKAAGLAVAARSCCRRKGARRGARASSPTSGSPTTPSARSPRRPGAVRPRSTSWSTTRRPTRTWALCSTSTCRARRRPPRVNQYRHARLDPVRACGRGWASTADR